jgi:hypothetical protein
MLRIRWRRVSGIANMLKRTKTILTFSIWLIIFSGCQNGIIPVRYNVPPSKIGTIFTGSWMEIIYYETETQQIQASGELIAINDDTVYVLTMSAFLQIDTGRIKKAVLYVFKPQVATGPVVGGLSFLPNIVGALAYSEGYFLLIGAPVLISGTIFGLLEIKGNSTLRYPEKNNFQEFKKFARFPQGLPPGLQTEKLHLVY